MRALPLLALTIACAPPLLEQERAHCLSSLECPADHRCVQQQCIANEAPVEDAGPGCNDPDDDGAEQGGLNVQAIELQTDRHLCPGTPDRYRYDLTGVAQVQAWAVSESGQAPKLQLVPRDDALPSGCDVDAQHCAEGGQLTGLDVDQISDDFDLGVVSATGELDRYEVIMRVGSGCRERADCGSSGRCVRPISERVGDLGNEGICVFSQDLPVDPDCDRNERSSEHAESAPDTGSLDGLRLADVPLCQHDNDWYGVTLAETDTVTRSISIRAAAAEAHELSQLTLFVGLYAATDLRPLRVNVLRFNGNADEKTISFSNVASGAYRLRVTQVNSRSGVMTYSIDAP